MNLPPLPIKKRLSQAQSIFENPVNISEDYIRQRIKQEVQDELVNEDDIEVLENETPFVKIENALIDEADIEEVEPDEVNETEIEVKNEPIDESDIEESEDSYDENEIPDLSD